MIQKRRPMDIIVCVKQVPDTTDVKTDPKTGALIRKGVPSIINPTDRHAIEAALQLREEHGGSVTALSMGPPQVRAALLEAYAMGVDDAVLLADSVFAGSDTWATAGVLAAGVRRLGRFDIILCGRQAIDGETAQTGPQLAEGLGIPQATEVQCIRQVDTAAGRLVVEQASDFGCTAVDLPIPCLLAVTGSLNNPRYPRIARVVKAHREFKLKVWGAADVDIDPGRCGLAGSPTRVVREFEPEPTSGVQMIEGQDAPEQVRNLVECLQTEHVLG